MRLYPLKATTTNQECRGARDEERNDADLKMSAGVAFLIVYAHFSTQWCAWSCSRLFTYLNSAFCLYFLWKELKSAGKKGLWLIVERTEAHYRETGWTLATHAIHLGSHGAHYPFGETMGQGATTCPLQLPQKHVPQNSKVTLDGTLLFFPPSYLIC